MIIYNEDKMLQLYIPETLSTPISFEIGHECEGETTSTFLKINGIKFISTYMIDRNLNKLNECQIADFDNKLQRVIRIITNNLKHGRHHENIEIYICNKKGYTVLPDIEFEVKNN